MMKLSAPYREYITWRSHSLTFREWAKVIKKKRRYSYRQDKEHEG